MGKQTKKRAELQVIRSGCNTLLGHDLLDRAGLGLRHKEPDVQETNTSDDSEQDKGTIAETLVQGGEDQTNHKVGAPVDSGGDGGCRGESISGQELREQQPGDGAQADGERGNVQEHGHDDQDTDIDVRTNDQEDRREGDTTHGDEQQGAAADAVDQEDGGDGREQVAKRDTDGDVLGATGTKDVAQERGRVVDQTVDTGRLLEEMDQDTNDGQAAALGGEQAGDRVVVGGGTTHFSSHNLGVGLHVVILKGRVTSSGSAAGVVAVSEEQLNNVRELVLNVGVVAAELLERVASLLKAVLGDQVAGGLDQRGEHEELDQARDTVDGEEDAPAGSDAEAEADQVGDENTDDDQELEHGAHGTTALDSGDLSDVGGGDDTAKTASETNDDTTNNELGLVVGEAEEEGADDEEDIGDEHGPETSVHVLDGTTAQSSGKGAETEGTDSEALRKGTGTG